MSGTSSEEINEVSSGEKKNNKKLSFEIFKQFTNAKQRQSLLDSGWSNNLKDIFNNEWLLSEGNLHFLVTIWV